MDAGFALWINESNEDQDDLKPLLLLQRGSVPTHHPRVSKLQFYVGIWLK